MARNLSSQFKSTIASVSSEESLLILAEISHADLAEPVRVINDTQDLTSNGNLFIACPFRFSMPDDFEGQIPKARIAVDNIGRDLMYWIETSGGGAGSTIRILFVMRSRPDLIEFDQTFSMFNVVANMQEISADLGFENFFSTSAIKRQYRPDNSPGLF